MMSRTLVIALATLATAGSALAATTHAPEPTKSVDMAKFYTGSWVEIGRRPMSITDGCVAGATAYKAESATKVAVMDTCHDKTPTGKLKSLGGPGTILDPGTNAKIHVSYRLSVLTVPRDYWVLDHDDDYTWFISSDPTFHDLWIYTRDPHVDPALLEKLKAKATAFGYDVSKLEFPAQP